MRLWKDRAPRPVSFEAFGVQVEVTLSEKELASAVQEILPPGAKPCESSESAGKFGLRQTEPDGFEVTVGETPWLEHGALEVAVGMLDAQIRLYIAARAPDLIFVHAGVVACDASAIVIPGESFTGKSTLVKALVKAGATYYSDEYAVLDSDGRVHPYARRLSIRRDDGTSTESHVGELGGVAAESHAALTVVLITRYRAGTAWQPDRLPMGEGVLAMLANTVPAQERPAEALRVLSRAVAGATVLKGDRGEASSMASGLLRELDALAAR